MSAEERQLLETIVSNTRPQSTASSKRVTSATGNGVIHNSQSRTQSENGAVITNANKTNSTTDSEPRCNEAENLTENAFLRTALSFRLEGPADWSANVDHYLYG
ncbi:MAG: hypothetical protein DCF25_18385 [Leptolyngbya foveolarum]|uniref:Uncharacterized protein n=1 Tax=Leptolyngbya foveolarum TaxID=47253 RepID=A0A2W4TWJ3_9CYAN|nr:MAG: hypothetical protein DCF25_18385 [Leptolyngbya foveolarum]